MKKQITAFLIVSMLAIMAPIAASAQQGRYCAPRGNGYYRGNSRNVRDDYYRGNSRNVRRNYEQRYNDNGYYNDGYYNNGYRRPNVYQRHRTAFNLAIGTGAGATVGALVGGKKGALIGGVAGLVGGAIVTKVQKSRNRLRY